MIVVDTNVIVYLLIAGDFVALAESVYDADSEWAAPLLWRHEFRNVLTLYMSSQSISLEEAVIAMAEAEKLIGERATDVDSARVLELAAFSGCTAYDCEFIHAAETRGVQLVTQDKKLLLSFPKIAVSMSDFVAA